MNLLPSLEALITMPNLYEDMIVGLMKSVVELDLHIITVFFTLLSFLCIPIASADSMNPGVYSIDAKPYGTPYSTWIVNWTEWLTSITKDKSPAADSDGRNCAINQSGPVWFLAGTFGGSAERICTIPAGKAVLSAILSGFCTYLTDNFKSRD